MHGNKGLSVDKLRESGVGSGADGVPIPHGSSFRNWGLRLHSTKPPILCCLFVPGANPSPLPAASLKAFNRFQTPKASIAPGTC